MYQELYKNILGLVLLPLKSVAVFSRHISKIPECSSKFKEKQAEREKKMKPV